MHLVHHVNRIQDDLHKSSVFLFKNNTHITFSDKIYPLRTTLIPILLTLFRIFPHHHSAIHGHIHTTNRTTYQFILYSPPTCIIIILQAICCSFILSMCPNHHSTGYMIHSTRRPTFNYSPSSSHLFILQLM